MDDQLRPSDRIYKVVLTARRTCWSPKWKCGSASNCPNKESRSELVGWRSAGGRKPLAGQQSSDTH